MMPCPECRRVMRLFTAPGISLETYVCDTEDTDYKITVSVAEWEQTAAFKRSTLETNQPAIERKTTIAVFLA